MVNIYLFIELLGSANAGQAVDALKVLQMENCKFANVVMLSDASPEGLEPPAEASALWATSQLASSTSFQM